MVRASPKVLTKGAPTCDSEKWLMACRTASSNSMGPGMSRAGCGAWLDMAAVVDDEDDDDDERLCVRGCKDCADEVGGC